MVSSNTMRNRTATDSNGWSLTQHVEKRHSNRERREQQGEHAKLQRTGGGRTVGCSLKLLVVGHRKKRGVGKRTNGSIAVHTRKP
jgi:hypothetical protein